MNKDYVALTKCFICGEDGEILMCNKFNKGEPVQDMKEYHGKRIPYHYCNECQKILDDGYSALLEAMDEHTLTGRYMFMKRDVVLRLFDNMKESEVFLIHPTVFNSLLQKAKELQDDNTNT